jgi:hypothetical protein
MPISDADSKLLWGRGAGICSNPDCQADLTILLETGNGFNIGEMAHIIARNPGGRRGRDVNGPDSYGNLILLCPTCHRKIDKAPEGTYPERLLHEWKGQHEERIRKVGTAERFTTTLALKKAVMRLLLENHEFWRELGPKSEVAQKSLGSNMYIAWNFRKLDRVIPNNYKIMNLIENNIELLSDGEYSEYIKFKTTLSLLNSTNIRNWIHTHYSPRDLRRRSEHDERKERLGGTL